MFCVFLFKEWPFSRLPHTLLLFCRPVSDCFLFSLSSVGNRNSSVLFVCITVCGFLLVLFVFIVVHSSTIAETGLFSFIIFKILFVLFSLTWLPTLSLELSFGGKNTHNTQTLLFAFLLLNNYMVRFLFYVFVFLLLWRWICLMFCLIELS